MLRRSQESRRRAGNYSVAAHSQISGEFQVHLELLLVRRRMQNLVVLRSASVMSNYCASVCKDEELSAH
jgi:hypothetical protein